MRTPLELSEVLAAHRHHDPDQLMSLFTDEEQALIIARMVRLVTAGECTVDEDGYLVCRERRTGSTQ